MIVCSFSTKSSLKRRSVGGTKFSAVCIPLQHRIIKGQWNHTVILSQVLYIFGRNFSALPLCFHKNSFEILIEPQLIDKSNLTFRKVTSKSICILMEGLYEKWRVVTQDDFQRSIQWYNNLTGVGGFAPGSKDQSCLLWIQINARGRYQYSIS